MFNITGLINPEKLYNWIDNNKSKLSYINNSNCYTLDISRPFWLDDNSRSKLPNMPVFVGYTYEEVFTKMYEYCMENFKWIEGGNVDLIDYHQSLNDLLELEDIIIVNEDDFYYIYHNDEYIKLTLNNFYLIEDDVIESIFLDKLCFFGCTEHDNIDCCFTVTQHPIY